MKIKVLPLEGLDSYYPCQGFYKLMFGLSMLPAYQRMSFNEFCGHCDEMNDSDKEIIIREAVKLVTLEPDEILKIVNWSCDPNGVRYCKENLKSVTGFQINELLVAVILEVAKAHKINIITDDEKKKLKISPSTLEKPSQSIPTSH